jgi:Domain of unknown function (DUF1707)
VVPVTAGPGDPGAADAAAGGYLRASHTDREHVIAALKAAFVQGMLTKEELDARVGQTFASRTHGELDALTADLPAGLIAARPPGKTVPAQAKPSANKVLLRGSWVVVLLTIGFMLGALPFSPAFALVVGVLPLLIAVPLAGGLTLDAWREKRSPGQLPPGPARSGQGLEGERDSATGDDLILCQAHRDTRARRLPGHSVTQRVWRSVPTRRASAGLCS